MIAALRTWQRERTSFVVLIEFGHALEYALAALTLEVISLQVLSQGGLIGAIELAARLQAMPMTCCSCK